MSRTIPKIPRHLDLRFFNNRLKYARLTCGLTQEEVAERAGMTQAMVSHLERQRSLGTTIHKDLACAVDASEEWLFSYKNDVDTPRYKPLYYTRLKVARVETHQIIDYFARRLSVKKLERVEMNIKDEFQKNPAVCLRMTDDSMTPPMGHQGIFEGEEMVIISGYPHQLGSFVLIQEEETGNFIVRQVAQNGKGWCLKALNPKSYPTLPYKSDRVCGTVLQVRRNFLVEE